MKYFIALSVLVVCLQIGGTVKRVNSDVLSFITREKCFPELGCFSAKAPFFDIVERPLSLLPDDRESINTKFLLFTPENPFVPFTFSNLDSSSLNVLVETAFNPKLKTKFVVPGFISKVSPRWKQPMINALLKSEASNVFLVDWTGGDGPLYEQAVANTRIVGAEIALFIKHLQNRTGMSPKSIHIIGHSLGSHIAGYAGKNLTLSGLNLGRITAMDPAGPYFTGVDPVVRLDRGDALLVDAIHTNAAHSRFQGFGMTESIGHFDFYPNGGHLQTGCKDMGHAILSMLTHPQFVFVEKKACYHGYGCFSNGPPFYHPIYRPLSVPPQPPEKIKTMFLLYTRRNRNRPVFISTRHPKSIKKSTFEPTSLTRVIIHGLNDNLAINSWFQRMKDVFLDRADENVIIVDWSGSNRIPYTISVANSRLVGAQVAELINFLYKSEGTSPESFHLIGHSLGAHVAGYAGERLHKLGRITGLDPAGPFFRHVPEKVRLDPSDAVFVDVIHTDPGISVLQGFGTPEDAGDLDFFPGGGDPPGCEQTFSRSIAEDLPTEAISNLLSCQHLRAYEFFIYSFNQNGCLFVGVECSSWPEFLKGKCDCGEDGERCAIMGVFSPTYVAPDGYHHKDRRLYLKVGPERPFCVHQYQVTIHLHTKAHQKTYGYETVLIHLSVQGTLEKLEGKLNLDIGLYETNQVKKFLLSTDRPIGDVESATVTLYGKPASHSEVYPFHSYHASQSDVIVDKVEINYLFPLPKHITSALLCRTSENPKSHGSREFQFSTKVCY